MKYEKCKLHKTVQPTYSDNTSIVNPHKTILDDLEKYLVEMVDNENKRGNWMSDFHRVKENMDVLKQFYLKE